MATSVGYDLAVPRIDTSPIAHRLLEHFGSLEAVLSAPMCELKEIKGLGDGGATLISLVLPLVRRARAESSRRAVIFEKYAFGSKRKAVSSMGKR